MQKITQKTNQGSDTGKYNKLLKESREWGLTNITKIPKITIIPKMTKITNQRNDSDEYNKPLGPVSDAELFMC